VAAAATDKKISARASSSGDDASDDLNRRGQRPSEAEANGGVHRQKSGEERENGGDEDSGAGQNEDGGNGSSRSWMAKAKTSMSPFRRRQRGRRKPGEDGRQVAAAVEPATWLKGFDPSIHCNNSNHSKSAEGHILASDQAVAGGSSTKRPTSGGLGFPEEEVSALSSDFRDDYEDDGAKLSEQQGSAIDDGRPIRRSLSSGTDTSSGDRTFVVGPVLDFLTADATLFLYVCVAIALYPTSKHWTVIREEGQAPLQVVASWLLVAFSIGQVASTEVFRTGGTGRSMMWFPATQSIIEMPTEVTIHKRDNRVQEEVYQQNRRARHSLLLKAFSPTHAKIKFHAAKSRIGDTLQKGIGVWTNLSSQRGRSALQLWERTADPTLDSKATGKDNLLMGRLLKNTAYRRMQRAVLHLDSGKKRVRISTEAESDDVGALPMKAAAEFEGKFDLSGADTLHDLDLVVVPQLRLRGLDVFMGDDPESEVATHPYLISHGLRDVPTVIINILTPWANLLIYLELPKWVDKIQGQEENPEDDEETIALKV